MKKLVILVIALIFTITAIAPDAMGQKKRKKHRGLATNIAIIGGSTAAGALIGRGRNGALIGAGAGTLYATSRKGTKRRYANSKTRRYTKVAGGALLGTGIGAATGGKTGAIIGGIGGGAATYLYTRGGRKYYSSKGRKFYVRNGRRVYL